MDNFNWKDSEGHLFLLSKFIRAQEPKYFYSNQEYWGRILGESPQKAIKRFVEEEILVRPSLDFLVSYKYKVTELKGMLRQQGMPISGKKDELANRIIQVDEEAMENLVSETELLVCTQLGREIAEQYKASENEKRSNVEKQIFDYLTQRMLGEASLLAGSYIDGLMETHGLGKSWKRPSPEFEAGVLKIIFNNKPEILSNLDETKLETLRMGAAMLELLGTNSATKRLPPNFETGLTIDNDSAARMLLFNAMSIIHLKQYKESSLKYVEVLGATTSCSFCKNIAGKRYAINEAPTLPNPKCTHELGCRCVYLPCIDK
jgi:SAP domain